jgi:hypothetical protein
LLCYSGKAGIARPPAGKPGKNFLGRRAQPVMAPMAEGCRKTWQGSRGHGHSRDFTACDQTTPEPNINWQDVITHGGRARGFSDIMPSFSAALTPEQVDDLVAYLRSFCRDSRWPRGELNLPRALVTEKAYPEDEVVLSTSFNARGAPGGTSHIIHEQRFGKNNQIEVDVPVNFQDENHTWTPRSP